MTAECDKYVGRLKDLCFGYGLNGRPDPSPEAIQSFREREGSGEFAIGTANPPCLGKVVRRTQPPKQPAPPPVSAIGTALAASFHKWFGAVPCGACLAAIQKLNGMTPEEVQKQRDQIVQDIASRAQTATPHWWQKACVIADQWSTGGMVTSALIGVFLDEACAAETARVE